MPLLKHNNDHSIYFQTVPINVMCKVDVQCSGSVTGKFARMDFELGTSIFVNDLQDLLRKSFQQLDKHAFIDTYVNGCLQVSATFTVVSDTSIVFGMKDKPQPALQPNPAANLAATQDMEEQIAARPRACVHDTHLNTRIDTGIQIRTHANTRT